MPSTVRCQNRYTNNRAEASHRHARQHDRQMRRFKSPGQAQRFLSVHSQVHNLFAWARLAEPIFLEFSANVDSSPDQTEQRGDTHRQLFQTLSHLS